MTGEVKFSRIPARAAGMELTATDWAVLHVICLHADKAGQAYPSLARIAALARIRRNHVSRSTKRLEHLGLLRSKRVSRGSGWANTRYEVVFEVEPDLAPEVGAPEGVRQPDPRVAPQMVTGGTSGGTTGGTSDGALTDHLTDQATDPYHEEEFQKESLSGGSATSVGDTHLISLLGKPARPQLVQARKPNGHAH